MTKQPNQNKYIIDITQQQIETLKDKQILKTMIYSQSTKEPLYYCEIVDNVKCKENIVMYVIQQGKESEWYYSTTAGKLEVSTILNAKRLILISIDYHNRIKHIDDVYYDLQEVSKLFHYNGLKFKDKEQSINILTDENGVGTRKLMFEKDSELNGTVWVEEVWNDEDDGSYFRRLLFSGERSLIQSEATIINDSVDIVRSAKTVNYFDGTVNCLRVFWKSTIEKNVCVLGGGVNIMANAIKYYMKNCSVTSVELDPVVYESYLNCFVVDDLEINCVVGDGMEYVKGKEFDCIVIDVDNKVESENDIAAPHPSFITEEAIKTLKKCVEKSDNGMIIFNIVARDEKQQKKVIDKIEKHFKTLYKWESDEDVNILLICFIDEDVELFREDIDDDERFSNTVIQLK